jgi:hypothetical protein
MEDTSEIYSDATIREWANNIRQTKIRELEKYIKTVKKHFGIHKSNMHVVLYVRSKNRIIELERKLETLKNTVGR